MIIYYKNLDVVSSFSNRILPYIIFIKKTDLVKGNSTVPTHSGVIIDLKLNSNFYNSAISREIFESINRLQIYTFKSL